MKKSIWIFLLAVLLPGFVLGWLALRSAEEQQIIFERRTAELYQKETESLAASAREAVEAERRAFGDTVHRLLARSDAEALARDFTNSLMDAWPRKAVGFVLGPDGEMMSPSTGMAAKNAELRDFLWNNGAFLCSTQPAVVYPVPVETSNKAIAYGQTLQARAASVSNHARPALSVSGPSQTVLAQKGRAQMQQQAEAPQEARYLKTPIVEEKAEALAKKKSEASGGSAGQTASVVRRDEQQVVTAGVSMSAAAGEKPAAVQAAPAQQTLAFSNSQLAQVNKPAPAPMPMGQVPATPAIQNPTMPAPLADPVLTKRLKEAAEVSRPAAQKAGESAPEQMKAVSRGMVDTASAAVPAEAPEGATTRASGTMAASGGKLQASKPAPASAPAPISASAPRVAPSAPAPIAPAAAAPVASAAPAPAEPGRKKDAAAFEPNIADGSVIMPNAEAASASHPPAPGSSSALAGNQPADVRLDSLGERDLKAGQAGTHLGTPFQTGKPSQALGDTQAGRAVLPRKTAAAAKDAPVDAAGARMTEGITRGRGLGRESEDRFGDGKRADADRERAFNVKTQSEKLTGTGEMLAALKQKMERGTEAQVNGQTRVQAEAPAATETADQQAIADAPASSFYRAQNDALNRMVEPQQFSKTTTANWSAILPATADFRELTAGTDEGMLARFVQDKLDLIFWIRPPESPQMVFGCLVSARDLDQLWKEVLATRLVQPADRPSFVLALLDDKARPVATFPASVNGRDWKRPFVANEIGEVLPHWEAALYLATPTAVADTARGLRRTLSFTIAGAIALIAIGGWLVVQDVRRQLALAQQKTDFVSNVSHELKTPLTSIRMFAELMHDRPPPAEKQGQYLRIIQVEAERLTRLINNVLDFAKLERRQKRFDKKPLDLCHVITRVWEGQEMHLRDAGFTTRWNAAPGPYPVLGDEDALAQVLVNLLSNAEKYSQERKDIELVTWIERDWINVGVLDRGIGVPDGEERKIFEAFYRAHDSLSSGIQGSGLGLTLAQRLAREHGGEIAFERRQDGGSRFTLRLPLVPSRPASGALGAPSLDDGPAHTA